LLWDFNDYRMQKQSYVSLIALQKQYSSHIFLRAVISGHAQVVAYQLSWLLRISRGNVGMSLSLGSVPESCDTRGAGGLCGLLRNPGKNVFRSNAAKQTFTHLRPPPARGGCGLVHEESQGTDPFYAWTP
jgi:hypothetical protein